MSTQASNSALYSCKMYHYILARYGVRTHGCIAIGTRRAASCVLATPDIPPEHGTKVRRNFYLARVGLLFLEVSRKSLRKARSKRGISPKIAKKQNEPKKANAPSKASPSPNGSEATAFA